MSPLSEFLIIVIVSTGIILFYTFNQFKESKSPKLINLNKTKMKTFKTKTIENQKLLAETLNGRFAMIGLIAALGAYLTTGQIIPGFV